MVTAPQTLLPWTVTSALFPVVTCAGETLTLTTFRAAIETADDVAVAP